MNKLLSFKLSFLFTNGVISCVYSGTMCGNSKEITQMAWWFLEDLVKALRGRLLTVSPSSSSSQLCLILGRQQICGQFDIEFSLKMFGCHTDNVGHLLDGNWEVKVNYSQPVSTWYTIIIYDFIYLDLPGITFIYKSTNHQMICYIFVKII